jgi:type II pantothenate kinase
MIVMDESYLHWVSVDFGISNTDIVVADNGQVRFAMRPYQRDPTAELVQQLLRELGVDPAKLLGIAVTGGRHRSLPDVVGEIPVARVGELEAIGRGGQALLAAQGAVINGNRPTCVVVSAGSGTAVVHASSTAFRHLTGTAVGGGTMVGLGRVLINTMDPVEIDRLALTGDSAEVDLILRDVIVGPIGTLPLNATAVNFGRLAKVEKIPLPEHMAAGLVTMVGQVIALLSINAALSVQTSPIVITGHLTDMSSMRVAIGKVAELYGARIEMFEQAGHATALGALMVACEHALDTGSQQKPSAG